MKRILLSLHLLLFYVVPVKAQDSTSVIGKFIQGHPWTMDFGITSNLTLTTFQGATISAGKFISESRKMRFGLTISATDGSGDHTRNNYTADTLSSRSVINEDGESYSFELKFQYIAYATPDAHTSMYFGMGPLAGISWIKSSRKEINTYSKQEHTWLNCTREEKSTENRMKPTPQSSGSIQ